MKKSFMTRALAMGLSVAMAFSLSAATNVSVASAAAKPAMASKQFAVRVGGAAKSYKASTATQKSFKITKATVGNTDKATVSINSSKKSIKVTPGTVTGTTVVKVTFKNNKTKKSTTKSYRCVVKGEVKQDPAITSAKQATVKSFVVTTNFDAEAAQSKVTVKRGSSDVATDKVVFSDDGKTITILTTANIVAAEYTINVGDLSQTVKGEVSKVDKIEILGDKAAAQKDGNGNYTMATVGYKVTNQFGDDITQTTSLNVSASSGGTPTLDSKNHLITFRTANNNSVFMVNRDIITVTLVDTQTGKSANAMLTVSMEAYAKDITFEGVYNSEGKTLTEDTRLDADTFYLLFSAVDQYGNKFKSYKGVKEGKDLFLSVLGGMTTLAKPKTTVQYPDFIVITKDNTDYLAFPVSFEGNGMDPQCGEATIQLLSTGGTSVTGTVTVAEGTRVTELTVNSPGVIAAGEKTDLVFTATDAAGKEVTSYKILKNVEISGSNTTANKCRVKWVKNLDGTGKLVLDAEDMRVARNQNAMQTYTFKTTGLKFFHTQLSVTENARPVTIDGLRDVDTTISAGTKYVEIKLKNLKVEDQYGRIMSNSALKKAVTTETGIYKLRMSAGDIDFTSVDPSGNGVSFIEKFTSFDKGDDTVLCKIKPEKKGDCAIDFQIHNGYGDNTNDGLNNAVVSVLFTVKDTTEVETATVSVSDVYVVANNATQTPNKAKYAQDVIVKANGAKLPASDYTISVTGNVSEGAINTSGGTDVRTIFFNGTQDDITEFKNGTASTVTAKIKVTLNGTGDTVTQDVTLSKVAPYVDKVSLKSDTYKTVVDGKIYPLSNYNVFDACFSELKDQYGKNLAISDVTGIKFANGEACNPNVTFSFKNTQNDTRADGTAISNNGNKDTLAKLTIGTAFDAATMTVAFNGNVEDKKVAEINIVGVSGTDAVGVVTPLENYNNIVLGNIATAAAVAAIDGSSQLKANTRWADLSGAMKLQAVKAVKAVGATTDAIDAGNTIVKAVAASAAALEDGIKVNTKEITACTNSGIALTSIATVASISTAHIATGSDIVSQDAIDAVIDVNSSTGEITITGAAISDLPAAAVDTTIAYISNVYAATEANLENVYVTYAVKLKKDGTNYYFEITQSSYNTSQSL